MSPGKPRAVDNIHSFYDLQINVVNKRLVPPLKHVDGLLTDM